MRFRALATDYDGTIARDGIVDEATVTALCRLRDSGRKLVLVTGRELPSLFDAFTHSKIFDVIVAENGAVLYEPASETIQPLAEPAPPALVVALRRAKIPLSVGHSIVATDLSHQHVVLQVIHDQRLEWHVILNKGSVMALPSSVNKATGLAAALGALAIAPPDVVGVGDAENDEAFLKSCGLAVAVGNALDELKTQVNLTTTGADGDGVQELIERLVTGELDRFALSAPSEVRESADRSRMPRA
jgi:hydroxymethylpyrimidine pyrophosphatase-like HAD family hydrolase